MKLCCAGLAVLALAACEPNDANHYDRDRVAAGSFAHVLQTHQNHPRAGTCDRRDAARQARIAAALDARSDAIERTFKESKTVQSGLRPFGPISISDEATGPQHRMQTGWRSWQRAEAYLDWAEGSDDWQDWLALYAVASSMLMDDGQRLGGVSMGVTDRGVVHLQAMRAATDACLAQARCTRLALPWDAEHFATADNPVYAGLLRRLEQARLHHEKRHILRELTSQLDTDLEFFEGVPNGAIQVRGNEFILPLDPGPFAPVQDQLRDIIERHWQTPQLGVRVQWVSQSENAGAYRFVAHTTDGRAFVSRSHRTINLFTGTHVKAIAHELGHVLGLADHYYTQWHEAQCEYEVSIDNDDIMSNHLLGNPTASEWQQLRTWYEVSP